MGYYPTGWRNFKGNIGALAEHFHVYAVDMPGWGESDAVTVEQLDHVEAVLQFMDALGIKKAAFIGNSMSGQTSLCFATEHPNRISHLIKMGAPVGQFPTLFAAGDGPSEGLKTLIKAYQYPSPENMQKLVEIMCFDKAKFATPELCKARSYAAMARPEHLQNYVTGLPKGTPLPKWVDVSKLHEIKVPSMFIHDRVISYETSLLLTAHVPNSRLVLINQCGHWAMIEHEDEFNSLVIQFLKQ